MLRLKTDRPPRSASKRKYVLNIYFHFLSNFSPNHFSLQEDLKKTEPCPRGSAQGRLYAETSLLESCSVYISIHTYSHKTQQYEVYEVQFKGFM